MNTNIERIIFNIRNYKVMLDSDLAQLYGVETKVLNQAVKRNLKRFPEDFSFIPNSSELSELRSQIVTLGSLTNGNPFVHPPRLFTENGVAMLSSVLKSDTAIEVNISIMRFFTQLRSKSDSNKTFDIIFDRLETVEDKVDIIEKIITPRLPSVRKKIGLR
jgi:vacuolar-type H+-ATPase subunit D/Vma8